MRQPRPGKKIPRLGKPDSFGSGGGGKWLLPDDEDDVRLRNWFNRRRFPASCSSRKRWMELRAGMSCTADGAATRSRTRRSTLDPSSSSSSSPSNIDGRAKATLNLIGGKLMALCRSFALFVSGCDNTDATKLAFPHGFIPQ